MEDQGAAGFGKALRVNSSLQFLHISGLKRGTNGLVQINLDVNRQ